MKGETEGQEDRFSECINYTRRSIFYLSMKQSVHLDFGRDRFVASLCGF